MSARYKSLTEVLGLADGKSGRTTSAKVDVAKVQRKDRSPAAVISGDDATESNRQRLC